MTEKPRKVESALIMLSAALFAFALSPSLLLHGRVFAEEGSEYFQYAWDAPWLTALLARHMGYYSLLMNGTTVTAAHLIPLESVGFFFTSAALRVLLLAVYLAAPCEMFRST